MSEKTMRFARKQSGFTGGREYTEFGVPSVKNGTSMLRMRTDNASVRYKLMKAGL